MRPTAAAGRVERFKIARGAVANMRPVLLSFIFAVASWLVVMFWLLPMLPGRLILLGPAGLVALAVTLLVYMNLSGRLDLGSDGVLVDGRGHKRYVPFTDLEEVTPYKERVMGKTLIGVSLVLRSSDTVKVPIGEDQFGADARVAELSSCIRAALEAHRRREEREDSSMLARGDRSTEAWLTRLRSLGEGANAGPREAPVPAERLFRIAEDPSVEASARAGAAIALSRSLDEEGKRRLRVAAEATAAPRLRIALESAVAGDDEAAAAALEEMEKEAAG